MTDVLCNLDNKILRSFIKEGSLKQIIPDEELNSIRFRGAMVIRAYIAFVYMRSKQLERCLDSIKENSPIRPFRDFFRQGSKKNSSDTIGQHIRNSLSHGDFKLSDDLKSVQFNDRTRQYKIDSKLFYEGLCHQLERFYFRFYEVRNKRIL
ncbi:MAG: hypothetical protein FJY65_12820 [Calditrichaeota bacterium]|nr:hypothetical protein [Calditrichota bacterium]